MNTPRNHGKKWTKPDDVVLLNYKKAGYINEQIAHYLGRTEYDIECRLTYLKEKKKPIITRENAQKYLKILHAFTKGETIEVLSEKTWLPITTFMFTKPIENYRVQPKWYRLAKMTCGPIIQIEVANQETDEEFLENEEGFICWLTERIEYT